MQGAVKLDFEYAYKLTQFNTSQGSYFRPVLPVRLCYQNEQIDTDAMVDTGADISMFQLDIARALNIPDDQLRKDKFILAIGTVDAWLFPLHIIVQGTLINCRCAFVDNPKWPNVLGRETIFSKMKFAFRQEARQFYLSFSP
jgi:hypothetical protein